MHPSALIGEQIFGEYTIVDHLGDGATGAVYLARNESIDKPIAVKVLQAEAAEDDETVQRFKREALAISLLSHPNIIRVLIFGRTDSGLLYLAMEYIEGFSLHELIMGSEVVDEMRIIKIFKQLCSALAEAHEMGIVHRDLKPENILLTEFRGEQDVVKVLDFGLAKIGSGVHQLDEDKPKLTKAGIVYGTPAYISPEQAQAGEIDHRCDIYALGCILYEFVTGQLPFEGETAVHVLGAHVHEEVTPPSKVVSGGVHPTMENIILKAMAKPQEERFQSATAMLQALEMREREIISEESGAAEVNTELVSRSKPSEDEPNQALWSVRRLWFINGIIVGSMAMLSLMMAIAFGWWLIF